MNVLPVRVGMTAVMKKPHPCGGTEFTVLRTGADVRVRCHGCGREMLFDRVKFEKAVKRLTEPEKTGGDEV